jgi:hypothetical protein
MSTTYDSDGFPVIECLDDCRRNGMLYRRWSDGTRQWFDDYCEPGDLFQCIESYEHKRGWYVVEYDSSIQTNEPFRRDGPFPTLAAAKFAHKLLLS